MRQTEKSANSSFIVEKIFLMRKVRLVMGIFMMSLGLLLWFFNIPGFKPNKFFLIVFCEMFVNQPYVFVINRIKNKNLVLLTHQIFDVILITLSMHFMGGTEFGFGKYFYFIVIIFAGVIVTVKSSFLIAGLCSLGYLSMLLLGALKIMPENSIINFHLTSPLNLIYPLFICSSFFLVAFVSSFLASILKRQSEQSEEALEKLKKAENTMIQAEKLAVVGQFATGIIHELKNPLGIILSGLEFLEKEVSNCPDAMLSINKVKNGAIRANDIIKELLNFSRPSEHQLQTVDLNTVLNENIKLLKGVSVGSNIQIVKDFSKNPLLVRLNSNQFEQVIFNIVVNACDAMPHGGKIFIRTFSQEYKEKGFKTGFRDGSFFVFGEKIAVLEVQDEGGGIPKEHINKVFDPFFTTKQKKENVGLGLSICRRIIDAHKGEIDIKSLPGKGTILAIRLPLFEEKKKRTSEI